MPNLATSEGQSAAPVEEAAPLYAIDLGGFQADSRSLWKVVSSRFCRSCQRKYGATSGGESPRSKRPAKAAKEPDPLEVIHSCCSKTTGYLDSNLPIAEAMFRVILARGNRPIGAAEMQSSLESWAAPAERHRDLSARALQRILDNATFYNIRRVPSDAAESKERA